MEHQGPVVAQNESLTTKAQKYLASVIDCETCGYAHLSPLPTREDLGEFYAYHFYEKQKPEYLTKFAKEEPYWLRINEWRYGLFKRHIQNPNPRVLDVGSSGGLFLAAAKKHGATVLGIEPSEKAATYGREKYGIQALVDIYENCELEKNSFDLIYSSLVMEHLREPAHFLKWSLEHLKPGGIFVAEVPHEFNRYQNLLVKEKNYPAWFVAAPDHLNYFTQTSLAKLAENAGMKHLRTLCTYPMEQFALQGMDYLREPSWGPKVHQARIDFEMNLLENHQDQLLEDLYVSWAESGIGRTQILIFQKAFQTDLQNVKVQS